MPLDVAASSLDDDRMDAPQVTMNVINLDGTVREKAMNEDLSIQLYKEF